MVRKFCRQKEDKEEEILLFVSLFFLSLDCPFFGCFEDLLALHILKKQERESARERTKAKHFCVIYIYTHI